MGPSTYGQSPLLALLGMLQQFGSQQQASQPMQRGPQQVAQPTGVYAEAGPRGDFFRGMPQWNTNDPTGSLKALANYGGTLTGGAAAGSEDWFSKVKSMLSNAQTQTEWDQMASPFGYQMLQSQSLLGGGLDSSLIDQNPAMQNWYSWLKANPFQAAAPTATGSNNAVTNFLDQNPPEAKAATATNSVNPLGASLFGGGQRKNIFGLL